VRNSLYVEVNVCVKRKPIWNGKLEFLEFRYKQVLLFMSRHSFTHRTRCLMLRCPSWIYYHFLLRTCSLLVP